MFVGGKGWNWICDAVSVSGKDSDAISFLDFSWVPVNTEPRNIIKNSGEPGRTFLKCPFEIPE